MTLALSRRRFLGTCSALGGLIALHPFSARAQAGQAHLRILSTTDLHCHVRPYDYYADKPTDTVGLSRTASIIEAIRAEATNTLLVDNGDYLQGNPMGDYIAYKRGMKEGDVHPVIAGMNTLAYEAGTLGNHEFNYGVEFLDLVNAGATFPIVCANFAKALGASPRDDDLHLDPYVILSRTITDGAGEPHAIKIGLIGFVPPQIMLWDRGHLDGRFQARDILEAARAWVPEMREAGADVVVALSHSGIDASAEAAMAENASLQLAGIDGVDAVVTGHQHLVWPSEDFAGDGIDLAKGTLAGKPAVMAGFWGSHMGLIDLMLQQDGEPAPEVAARQRDLLRRAVAATATQASRTSSSVVSTLRELDAPAACGASPMPCTSSMSSVLFIIPLSHIPHSPARAVRRLIIMRGEARPCALRHVSWERRPEVTCRAASTVRETLNRQGFVTGSGVPALLPRRGRWRFRPRRRLARGSPRARQRTRTSRMRRRRCERLRSPASAGRR